MIESIVGWLSVVFVCFFFIWFMGMTYKKMDRWYGAPRQAVVGKKVSIKQRNGVLVEGVVSDLSRGAFRSELYIDGFDGYTYVIPVGSIDAIKEIENETQK